jgi:DNA-binding ferritin-like protein (Dps family)
VALVATSEEQLEDLRRRIEQLALIAKAAATGTELGRRISELQTLEASTRAAAHSAAARIEENVLDLDTRCKIAEQAVAAELSEDKGEFVRALMRELQGWDMYLERLQVKVATTAGDRRDQAEGAIRQLRRHRNMLGAGMAEVASTSGEGWYEVRKHVKAARDELESRAAEVEATLHDHAAAR